MSQVIVTAGAIRGLARCKQFLVDKNQLAERRAAQAIKNTFMLLEKYPDMGRPYSEDFELRELIIEFGDSGYVALYRYNKLEDIVYVLAFRHQKESGY